MGFHNNKLLSPVTCNNFMKIERHFNISNRIYVCILVIAHLLPLPQAATYFPLFIFFMLYHSHYFDLWESYNLNFKQTFIDVKINIIHICSHSHNKSEKVFSVSRYLKIKRFLFALQFFSFFSYIPSSRKIKRNVRS